MVRVMPRDAAARTPTTVLGPVPAWHDRGQRGDHRRPAVPHGHGDAERVLVHVTGQAGVTPPPYLGERGAQRGRGGDGGAGVAGERAGHDPLLQFPVAVREQDQAGGRDVQRQPPGDPGVVDDRARRGQPFHEQHLVAVEHAELHVVAEHRVRVLQERHGRLAQAQGRRRAQGQFPHPHAHPDVPARVPGEQAVGGELGDQPGRGRRVEPRTARDLRHGQHGLVRSERLEDANRAGQHGLAGRRPGHTRTLTRCPCYPRAARAASAAARWSRNVSAPSLPGCRPKPQYIATPKSPR